MAVIWKSPTLANYIAPGGHVENQHIEGLPLNTRGGLLITLLSSRREYKFEIQNFGLAKYTPGEKIEFLVDGERVNCSTTSASLEQGCRPTPTVPSDHGSGEGRVSQVGVTFLATNYRPRSSDPAVRTKVPRNNSIPQLQYYPAIGLLPKSRVRSVQPSEDSRSMRKVFTCPSSAAIQEDACAGNPGDPGERAFRRPVTALDMESLLNFYVEGRAGGRFEDGIELALRRCLATRSFLSR